MISGICHCDPGSGWNFDGLPVRSPSDVPRSRAWSKRVFYCPANTGSLDFAKIMGPGDECFGAAPGDAIGIKIRCEGGSYRILRSTTWGVDSLNPNQVFSKIWDLQTEAAACGLRVRNSVAATALQYYLDRYDGRGIPSMRQLPSRWRGMSHSALHGGPIQVCKAHAPYAIQIDINNAYLAAMKEPFPVYGDENDRRVGGYVTFTDGEWGKIRHGTGFVEATVKVKNPSTGFGPLPVTGPMGTYYPWGEIRGCWSMALVRWAEETGLAEVRTVHNFAMAQRCEPIFARVAEDFGQMPRSLGKLLYTRFWGKPASTGGYIGIKSDTPIIGDAPRSGLWWSFDGIIYSDHTARPTYRPDLSALIAASNHVRMQKALHQLSPHSIVATHVDAIWTTDLRGAARLTGQNLRSAVGEFRTKRAGEVRFYGPGIYDHDGDIGASGYDSQTLGPVSRRKLKLFAARLSFNQNRHILFSRKWTADPAISREANSLPLFQLRAPQHTTIEGPSPGDFGAWTSFGWVRK